MVTDKPLIQIILGSTREGRFGPTVGQWIRSLAEQRDDIVAELIDLRDWPLPFFNEAASPSSGRYAEEAKPWAEKIAQGDGYVWVVPEYNHGYPAVLKNALDHVYKEWNRKPVGMVGYGSAAGGARAVEQLRLVAIELQMAPIRSSVVIPRARSSFDEQGQPINSALNDQAGAMFDQLVWWAAVLKQARSELVMS